jgi:hypothetical protein
MKPSLSNTHEGLISKYQKYLDLKWLTIISFSL